MSRTAMRSGWLRIATVAFFAFLPVTVLHSVAFAADGLAVLPFLGICSGLILLARAKSAASYWWSVAGLIGVLLIANLIKFTFIAMVAVAVAFPIILWWRAALSLRRMLVTCGLVVAIAGGAAGAMRVMNSKNNALGMSANPVRGMTLSSLVLPKWGDGYIFQAPGYFEPVLVDGKPALNAYGAPRYRLLDLNAFSYPALTQLAIFTDILNLADNGIPNGGIKRAAFLQSAMALSVKTGLVAALFILVAVLHSAAALVWKFFTRAPVAGEFVAAEAVTVAAVAGVGIIAASLLFVEDPYYWGYWLPRLILPSLAGFCLVGGIFADRWFAERWRWAGPVIFGAVLFQSSLQVSFLWH